MARKLTEWNKAVQKQFKAGKALNKEYSFKQALQDASKAQSGGNDENVVENQNGVEELPMQGGSHTLEGSLISVSDKTPTLGNSVTSVVGSGPSVVGSGPILKLGGSGPILKLGGKHKSHKKHKSLKKKNGGKHKSHKNQKKPKSH